MIKIVDLAWLGGLLEGEGCFSLHLKKYPIIIINMTAEDTIDKVAAMWNRKVYHRRNQWRTQVTGAYAISWMMTLYPFLGKCRQDSIINIIKFWKKYPYSYASKGLCSMSTCHSDRIVHAFGLCSLCYSKKQRKKSKLLKKVG